MKQKFILLTAAPLLLCIAAWLAGRYSATVSPAMTPPNELDSSVASAANGLTRTHEPEHSLSIPPEALETAETFEAWLSTCLGEPDYKPKELWVFGRALHQIRMVERFRDLNDDSVRRLAEFLGKREIREHFESAQTFPGVISRALAELTPRDRAALPAWIMRASMGNEDGRFLFYNAGDLTFRERMELAQQISSRLNAGETAEPWQVAFGHLRLPELAEATRVAEALPEERRNEAFKQIARSVAYGEGAARADWQHDFGPTFARAFPESKADDLNTHQLFYAMFSNRLANDESGLDCATWLQTQSMEPRLHSTAATELMSAWMHLDAPAAAAWRLAFSPSEDQSAVLEQIVSKWAQPFGLHRVPLESRTADAAEWLQTLTPGPEADRARAALARSWSILREPEAGAAWAAAITDPALREKTQREIADPLKASFGGHSWQGVAAAQIVSQK